MEERDLIKAKSFLAEGFQMEFPGGEIFTDLSLLTNTVESKKNINKHPKVALKTSRLILLARISFLYMP